MLGGGGPSLLRDRGASEGQCEERHEAEHCEAPFHAVRTFSRHERLRKDAGAPQDRSRGNRTAQPDTAA